MDPPKCVHSQELEEFFWYNMHPKHKKGLTITISTASADLSDYKTPSNFL